ncbi:YceD family protein [Hutsoniella sourekii]|uniref:YceD family protein n=1 Tax=Hutsoniella sourekii TaxID=87650 RepID=UPI00048882EA|nr:YceD family protein [Hutsoniella sourekii]
MKWTIREIKEHPEDVVSFQHDLEVDEELMNRNDQILAVDSVSIAGYFTLVDASVYLHGEVDATVTVPSTRSLKPVTIHLSVPVKERYVYEEDDHPEDLLSEETTLVLTHDYIDLDEVAIDSILLNIPNRVLAEGEEAGDFPSGDDWTVITEEDLALQREAAKENTVDPRFQALKTLLDDSTDSSKE